MFGNWSSYPVSTGPDGRGLAQIYRYKGPLMFPGYSTTPPPPNPTFSIPPSERSFYSYFAKIKRATDVTPHHLDVLNVTVSYNVPVEELVGGTEWFPAEEDKIWDERKRELLIENSVANEVMSRTRRDIKLGHMYKFFQALEMVAPYYGTPAECAAYAEEQAKKASDRQSKPSEEDVTSPGDKMDLDPPSPPSNDNGKRPAAEEATGAAKRDRASPESDFPESEKKKEEKFSMPERFRDDLVKNFVEPICWGHGVRVYPPRAPPKLHIQYSKFSIHLNYHIHWTPTDSQEARSGLVEGPVLGMQIRHEHAFRALSDPAAAIKKRRKKLIAAALAAKVPPTPEQEAERKKKAEKEKARAERHAKRRAAAGIAPKKEEEKEEKEIVGEMKEEVEDLGDEGILVLNSDGAALDVLGVTREIAALLSIAQLRAKEGTTEKKVRFRAIGHSEGSYWDDVFMVTCLHHHVSISHLRVSKPYLRFLRTGKLPNKEHPFVKEGGWEKLHLRKTKYWSLMVPADRVEAAKMLVTVLNWVTRNEKK